MVSLRVEGAPQAPGIWSRILRGAAYFSVSLLALVGFVAICLEIYSWHSGTRWQPTDIDILLQQDGRLLRAVAGIWENIRYFIQYGAYFLAALALFIAVTQIRTVAQRAIAGSW
jgi:hypothetical protein